jgi:7-cyano-7-deazaguanine reductase
MKRSLGNTIQIPDTYSPTILDRIQRTRNNLGVDIWTCYEVSWINEEGVPQYRIAQMKISSLTTYIVESKSLKLYLNGFNNIRLSEKEFIRRWESDISALIESPVSVTFYNYSQWSHLDTEDIKGTSIDEMTGASTPLLDTKEMVKETLVSHLFRSVCPVTSQPDWATILITYTGPKLNPIALREYIISFRNKAAFHESCIDEMYTYLIDIAQFTELSISGLFNRRGGIDIMPIRYNAESTPNWVRHYR